MAVQSMPDASPVKWHLAHTSWFFETFILLACDNHYQPYNRAFQSLFNSYYNGIGEQFSRPLRGVLSRPSLEDVLAYRRYIDEAIINWLSKPNPELLFTLELGLHHEQQHQELIVTDLKHAFWLNPLKPRIQAVDANPTYSNDPAVFHNISEGLYQVGASAADFSFDNEQPRHPVYLHDFAISDRLVTNQQVKDFIDDGGYQRPELWLSDGWSNLQQRKHPLYWQQQDNQWFEFTLTGLQTMLPNAPASHLSYYEADAIARWLDCRLPTEFEWEVAAELISAPPAAGHFGQHGSAQADDQTCCCFHGERWQWTSSGYAPYPGYRPFAGVAGEYNGKFMANQYVLRGGSCATPRSHYRPTYRNFFYPHQCWQFTGIRLVKN